MWTLFVFLCKVKVVNSIAHSHKSWNKLIFCLFVSGCHWMKCLQTFWHWKLRPLVPNLQDILQDFKFLWNILSWLHRTTTTVKSLFKWECSLRKVLRWQSLEDFSFSILIEIIFIEYHKLSSCSSINDSNTSTIESSRPCIETNFLATKCGFSFPFKLSFSILESSILIYRINLGASLEIKDGAFFMGFFTLPIFSNACFFY